MNLFFAHIPTFFRALVRLPLVLALCGSLLVAGAQAAPKAQTPQPPVTTEATAKRQVIVLPFDVEIPEAYASLKNGLAGILASRLATRANLVAVAQGAASEQMSANLKAGNFGAFGDQLRQSGADHLIIGSLTQRSSQFVLTCYVFSQDAGKAPKKFVQNFGSVDDAMTAVDDLAWDISGTVFGKGRPEGSEGGRRSTATSNAFLTAHPDRAYRDGQYAGLSTGLDSNGAIALAQTFRSRSIPVETMDMNAGDIDGDGKDEILLLTANSLMVYRYDDGQFRMLATVDLPNHIRYQAITLGDFAKKGRQQIFISGSNGDLPDSSALEWNGKKLVFLFEHVTWYLRTMEVPGEGLELLGQSSPPDANGSGVVHQMLFDGKGKISEGKRLQIPRGLALYDFVIADLDGSGSKMVVGINKNNRLQLFDTAGAVRWTSSETYGASSNFYGTKTSSNNAASSEKDGNWLHTRIAVADLDGDGINDILVGRNRLETVTFMPNLRYFDGSSLAAFKWEGYSLVRLWESRKIPGYITNYQAAGAQPGSRQYHIFFTESETSYPFVFWHANATYLNAYTLRINEVKPINSDH